MFVFVKSLVMARVRFVPDGGESLALGVLESIARKWFVPNKAQIFSRFVLLSGTQALSIEIRAVANVPGPNAIYSRFGKACAFATVMSSRNIWVR